MMNMKGIFLLSWHLGAVKQIPKEQNFLNLLKIPKFYFQNFFDTEDTVHLSDPF